MHMWLCVYMYTLSHTYVCLAVCMYVHTHSCIYIKPDQTHLSGR